MTVRLYLVGPMSGIFNANRPLFNAEAARLRELGYHVESPAENPAPVCNSWVGWMRLSLAQLLTCDEIAMLPGWETSRGSSIEYRLAKDLGMPIRIAAHIQSDVVMEPS